MSQQYNNLLFLLKKHFPRILLFATQRVQSLLHFDIAEEELDLAQNNWRGVLALSPHGRRSEGVDLPADAVVLAGVPYLPPYARVEKVGLTRDDVAMITTIQNIGRALRSPDANPLIVLADQRYDKFTSTFSEYFDLREVNDLQELDKAIKDWKSQFMHKQQQEEEKSVFDSD